MDISNHVVQPEGVGSPDGQIDVSSSIQRSGIAVKYGQQLKIGGIICDSMGSSVFPWTRGQLTAGEVVYAIDYESGTPGTSCLAGQGVDLFDLCVATSVKIKVWLTLDGQLVAVTGIISPGTPYYQNWVKSFATLDVDPSASSPHSIECAIKNVDISNGDVSLRGTFAITSLHTPPFPVSKVIRCHWCGYKWEVPREVTVLTCPSCKKEIWVFDFSHRRGVM